MDIKPQNNQTSGASADQTPSTPPLGPSSLFSQISVRTMLQDLEVIQKTSGGTPKPETAPAPSAQPKKEEPPKKPTPAKETKDKLPADKKARKAKAAEEKERLKKEAAEKAKKNKEEKERLKKEAIEKAQKAKEEKTKLAQQTADQQKKLKEARQKAQDLMDHQLFKEAAIELAKITNSPAADWWSKLKARSLANKAQKQLDKALIAKPIDKPIIPAPAKITSSEPIKAVEPSAAEIENLLKTTLTPPPTPVIPMPAPVPTPPTPVSPSPGGPAPAAPPIKSAAPPPASPLPPLPRPVSPSFVSPPASAQPASGIRPIPLPPGDLTRKPSQISAPKPPSTKKWVWFLGGAIILLLIIIPLALYLFPGQPASSPQASATPSASPFVKPTPSPPVALFKMDSRQTLAATGQTKSLAESMNALLQTDETAGNFVQVLIKITDSQNEITYADLTKTAQLLNLGLFAPATSSPSELIDQLKTASFSLFTYIQSADAISSPFNAGQNQARAGLIVALKETASTDNLYLKLKSLEPTLKQSLTGLLLGRQLEVPAGAVFLDNSYQNTAIRYLNLPQANFSIDYAIVGRYLIFTTSKDSMYAALDRILAETTISASPEATSPAPADLLP